MLDTVKNFWSGGMRLKFTAILIGVGLFCLAIGLAFNYAITKGEVEKDSARDLSWKAAVIQNAMQSVINKGEAVTLMSAQNAAYRQYFSDPEKRPLWLKASQNQMQLIRDTGKNRVDEVCFIAAAGPELARMVGDDFDTDLSFDESGATFFKPTLALGPGKVHTSRPYISPDSNRWVIAFAAPVIAENGAKVGLLHHEVNLQYVQELLQQGEDLGGDSYAFLVDDKGRVLANSREPVGPKSRLEEASGLLDSDSYRVAIGQLMQGTSGSTSFAEGNKTYWMAYRTIELGDGQKWHIAAALSQNSILTAAKIILPMLPLGLLSVFALIVISLLVTLWIRGMLEPLSVARQRLTEIAKGRGDLTGELPVTRNDEVGLMSQAFNDMISGLRELAKKVRATGEDIENSTQTILSTAEQQATNSAQQATAVTEITATIEELAQTAKQIAETADSVAKAASETMTHARSGYDAVATTVGGMQSIKHKVENIAERSLNLGEKSQQIGRILDLIQDIADQTNLLALNAAIEAARAGEHGRGFAVVASEVRELAERSVEATKDIKALITEIQAETNGAIMATEEGVREVERGVEVAQAAGVSLESILEMVEQTSGASQEISIATQQQRTASDQVVLAMSNVSEASKEHAVGTKQAAEATGELLRMASELREAARQFRVDQEKAA